MEKIKDSRFELVDSSKLNSEVVVRPNISYWKDAWRRLKKNPVAMGALFVLIGLILMSVLAPIIRNMDYETVVRKIYHQIQNFGLVVMEWEEICLQEFGLVQEFQ
jgi:hypothetical protein